MRTPSSAHRVFCDMQQSPQLVKPAPIHPYFSRPANQRPFHNLQSGISKLANCNSDIIPGFNVAIFLDLKSIKFLWKYPAEA
jgi:hypothetical protein